MLNNQNILCRISLFASSLPAAVQFSKMRPELHSTFTVIPPVSQLRALQLHYQFYSVFACTSIFARTTESFRVRAGPQHRPSVSGLHQNRVYVRAQECWKNIK